MAVAEHFGGRAKLEEIVIDRDARQRRDLGDLETLKASIRRYGLISPIILERGTRRLIAGERRLSAFIQLNVEFPEGGYSTIPFRNFDALDQGDLEVLELHENLMREDLSWVDKVRAIESLAKIFKAEGGDTSVPVMAQKIGISQVEYSQSLVVAEAVREGNQVVMESQTLGAAYNAAKRAISRSLDMVVADLLSTALPESEGAAGISTFVEPKPFELARQRDLGNTVKPVASVLPVPVVALDAAIEAASDPTPFTYLPPKPKSPVELAPIVTSDFATWALDYTGPQFNFVHCDFPYGINHHNASALSTPKDRKRYADSKDVFTGLCNVLHEYFDILVAPDAQMIFWFSMIHYTETLNFLRRLPGCLVDESPLIWTRNRGILPRANSGPRHNYETAFFVTRGRRKVVQAVSNVFEFSSTEEKATHASVKPLSMLKHFFRMCVDDTTRMLDPTCGSGTSVRASDILGAQSSIGIEIDPDFAQAAREQYVLSMAEAKTGGKAKETKKQSRWEE